MLAVTGRVPVPLYCVTPAWFELAPLVWLPPAPRTGLASSAVVANVGGGTLGLGNGRFQIATRLGLGSRLVNTGLVGGG